MRLYFITVSFLSSALTFAGGLVQFDQTEAQRIAEALNRQALSTELLGYISCQSEPVGCKYQESLSSEEIEKDFNVTSAKILVETFEKNDTVPRYKNPAGITYYWLSHLQCDVNPKTLQIEACYFADDV